MLDIIVPLGILFVGMVALILLIAKCFDDTKK